MTVFDSYPPALIFVPDLFVTSKMIEKLHEGVFFNDDKVFRNIDSYIFAFFSTDTVLNSINLNNINLDDKNFDDYDPKIINHLRLLALYNRYEQRKACKKGS